MRPRVRSAELDEGSTGETPRQRDSGEREVPGNSVEGLHPYPSSEFFLGLFGPSSDLELPMKAFPTARGPPPFPLGLRTMGSCPS